MDRAGRIAAITARLEAQRGALIQARGAGAPCRACIHLIPVQPGAGATERPLCGHMVYQSHVFDPITRKLAVTIEMHAEQARHREGLCGPEGALFQSRAEAGRNNLRVFFRDLRPGIYALAAFGALVLWFLFGFKP